MRDIFVALILLVSLSVVACSSEPKTKEFYMKDKKKTEAFLDKSCSDEQILKAGLGGKLHQDCENASKAQNELKHIERNSIGRPPKTQEYYDSHPEEADEFYKTRCANTWLLDRKLELSQECAKTHITYEARWKRGGGIKSKEYYHQNIEEAKAFREKFCNNGMRMPGLDNIYGELLEECNKVEDAVSNYQLNK